MKESEIQKQRQIEALMRVLANHVDHKIRETLGHMGFAIIVFEFNHPGVSNYISNASRSDMIQALRETADRLERNQDITVFIPRGKMGG